MANVLLTGYGYDGSGTAVAGDANVYARNTTTPVIATVALDGNGKFTFSVADGRYDVETVVGTQKTRRKYDDEVQLTTIETRNLRVRNPANTFKYDIVPAAIAADWNLTLPLITANDTLAALGLAQTFSAIQTFSAVPVMSGGAVGFPATQAASAGANDLDDYEEGTWTPAITFGGGSTGLTYTTQIGTYTKIGRAVMLFSNTVINSNGSSTGSALITALPFTAAAQTHALSMYVNGITFASIPQAYVASSTTTIVLTEVTVAGVLSDLTDVDLEAGDQIVATGFYNV